MYKNRFSRISSPITPKTLSQHLMRDVEFTFEPRTKFVEQVLKVLLESRFGWDIAEPVTIGQTRSTGQEQASIYDQCVLCVENFSGTRIVSYCGAPFDHTCSLCTSAAKNPQGRAALSKSYAFTREHDVDDGQRGFTPERVSLTTDSGTRVSVPPAVAGGLSPMSTNPSSQGRARQNSNPFLTESVI